MAKSLKVSPQKEQTPGLTAEEYSNLVGDIDSWEIDEEHSFPARAGNHAAPGTQILIGLDARQAALVVQAADARGVDIVRFAKEAVLDAAHALASPAAESVP
jgi:hypothetical protein